MAESVEMAILAIPPTSGHFRQEGRLGPPESADTPKKPEKLGKVLFSGFLRVPRASVQVIRG